jgi:hypothetical protein
VSVAKGLAKAKNLVLVAGDDESWRLANIGLLQFNIGEGGLHICVVDAIALLGCRHKDTNSICATGANASSKSDPSRWTNPHTTKCCLVLDHRLGLILLELEDRLKGDVTVASTKVKQLPRSVPLDDVHLLLHSGTPYHVSLCLREGIGLGIIVRQCNPTSKSCCASPEADYSSRMLSMVQ